jgi:serine O-acetyltransferase
MEEHPEASSACRIDRQAIASHRERLPGVVERIIDSCDPKACYTHINYEPIPSREAVIDLIARLREIVFPGYFSRHRLDPVNMRFSLGQGAVAVYDSLARQICHSVRHDCFRYHRACSECEDQGYGKALRFMETIPAVRSRLATDVEATLDGDPAASSYDEIIFSYPGILATTVYRLAHQLYKLEVPIIPRIMTEYAHSVTGIDIHPGARIGERFVIDHGTGVVIGETAVIGKNVRLYQGVTLGALSLPEGAGETYRGQKRHPTIEDNVIIYSGATILGGKTEIGEGSVVGGNVWLTESVGPDTTVLLEKPRLIYRRSDRDG